MAMDTGGLGPGPGPGIQEPWSDIVDKEEAGNADDKEGRSADSAGNKGGKATSRGSWAQILSSILPLSWQDCDRQGSVWHLH